MEMLATKLCIYFLQKDLFFPCNQKIETTAFFLSHVLFLVYLYCKIYQCRFMLIELRPTSPFRDIFALYLALLESALDIQVMSSLLIVGLARWMGRKIKCPHFMGSEWNIRDEGTCRMEYSNNRNKQGFQNSGKKTICNCNVSGNLEVSHSRIRQTAKNNNG